MRGWEHGWAMHRGCLSVLHSEYLLLVLQGAERAPTSGNPVLTDLGTWSLWNTYKYVLTAIKISELLQSIYVRNFSEVQGSPQPETRHSGFFQCMLASPFPSLHWRYLRSHSPENTCPAQPDPRPCSALYYWFLTCRSCHHLLFKFFFTWYYWFLTDSLLSITFVRKACHAYYKKCW